MKALALIPALLIGASATATPVDPGFSQGTITRGSAQSVRSCRLGFGEPFLGVCYNQVTSGQVFPFSRGVGISVRKERVVRLDCRSRVACPEGSTRAAVVAQFCPQVVQGTLAPAPFLL